MTKRRHSSTAIAGLAAAFGILLSGPQPALASSADQATFQLAQAGARSAGPAGAGQPSLLGQYGDWGAYTGGKPGAKVCFALAKPTSSQTVPPNRPRDPIYFFLTTR